MFIQETLYAVLEPELNVSPMDAIREWVHIVGRQRPECAWLCSDYDTWEKNPFYYGPAVPHPESDEAREKEGLIYDLSEPLDEDYMVF